MIKKNKKTLLVLLAYGAILVGIVLAFVFIMQARNSSAVVEVYYASRQIDAGMTVDSAFEINYISKTQIPKTVATDMEKHGAKPIYTTSQLKNNSVSQIPQGTILVESMFDNIVNESIMAKYSKEYGFKNPYYTTLKVDATIAPINGFSQDQKISIEGSVDLSSVSWIEDFSGNSNDSYSGIITNQCVVASLFTDDDENITNIGVVVELSDYPTINYFENYGSLKFHDGILENTWETTNSQIMTKLWEKTGFKDSIAKELATYIVYYDAENTSETKQFVCEYSNSPYYEDEEETIIKKSKVNFLQMTNELTKVVDGKEVDTSALSLYTPYKNFTITHYGFNGKAGVNMDLAGVNTQTTYNSRTGLYNMNFTEEGYYSINFYDKVEYNAGSDDQPLIQTKVDLVNQIKFVIEKTTENQKWSSDADLTLVYDNDVASSTYTFKELSLNGVLSKKYFEALESEAQIKLGEEFKLNDIVFTSINDLAGIKFFTTEKSLVQAGEQNVTQIYLNVGDLNSGGVSYPLFYNSNLGTAYEKATSKQIAELCYYLGLSFKNDYETAYPFTKYFTKAMLGDSNDTDTLLGKLSERASSPIYTINVSGLSKLDENGLLTTEKNAIAVAFENYMLGALWTGTFDYAKFAELKESLEGTPIEISLTMVLDDNTTFDTTITTIINRSNDKLISAEEAVQLTIYSKGYNASELNEGTVITSYINGVITLKADPTLSENKTVTWYLVAVGPDGKPAMNEDGTTYNKSSVLSVTDSKATLSEGALRSIFGDALNSTGKKCAIVAVYSDNA